MFNLTDSIGITIPGEDGEDRLCEVRLPGKEEWVERFKKRVTVMRDLGRGESTSQLTGKEEADLELLEKIQVNKKDEKFDAYEASSVIDQLATAEIVSFEKSGKFYVVTLMTCLGEVTHTLKIPSHRQLKECAEATVQARTARFGVTRITVNIDPPSNLYDEVVQDIEGYDPHEPTQVPLPHKHKVIDAIQGEIVQLKVSSRKEGSNLFQPTPGLSSRA